MLRLRHQRRGIISSQVYTSINNQMDNIRATLFVNGVETIIDPLLEITENIIWHWLISKVRSL